MKKAFSLLELIIVVFISTIVIISSLLFAKNIQETQIKNQELAILKIDLNATKIFLEKHKENISSKLKFENNILYFENSILLKEVKSFSLNKTTNTTTIKINLKDKISLVWDLQND
ncbi:type II secretion system protein [Arcobacter arenosus]|jgi:Tfp pilus assembly protein PilE|uniref:Prepilin-type N-terminal cleavage/methylation domain-containing protein n=1 Tax=Arcobacter arenosus TaxID=2576037 RepID=A0A5R8Y456_9BACT|nr:hypothetical protein [Arcobacter arenosus]TLP40889.1 hypothetical protein FDK22_02400 [Arcobacter arenosus]